MNSATLADDTRIYHPDFGDGTVIDAKESSVTILWDRQGTDEWSVSDRRWEQVEEAL